MSAMVASRSHPNSRPTSSRMANKSPLGPKKTVKSEEPAESAQSSTTTSTKSKGDAKQTKSSPPPDVPSKSTDIKAAASTTETTQPLAPPPRPKQTDNEAGDYFNNNHGTDSHFSLEPNPFEQSFGVPSSEAGKLLPPVASLTSPAPLPPNGSASSSFNWSNSLRAGPLSPAMLTGPTGATDYFDSHLRGGFPTPNESSLRTGLTPGGGGSMFPAPSPNSQALFQQLAGGATPSTIEFHRAAMNAAAVQKAEEANGTANEASNQARNAVDKSETTIESNPPVPSDPFGHDANDAANGLFLLAQARNGGQSQNQYVPVSQQPGINSSQAVTAQAGRNMSGSMGSASDSPKRGMSLDSQEFSEEASAGKTKPNTRNRGKKNGSSGKNSQSGAGSRRKAEETPSKAPANKKSKVSKEPMNYPDSDEDNMDMDDHQDGEGGKKMTDEEKRKNFLERNRVAALKCRQRKKQWLANLQTKVEIFSGENDALSAQVSQLREEIVNLKTLLLAHKDCPVSQAQGLGGMTMNAIAGDYNPHANPYSIGMPNGAQVMAGQQMQRR